MFHSPLHVNAYGFIDDERAEIQIIPLQYNRWGFRIDGGALQSYPTKAQAEEAYCRIVF